MERKRIVKSATAANTTERRLGEQKHWFLFSPSARQHARANIPWICLEHSSASKQLAELSRPGTSSAVKIR